MKIPVIYRTIGFFLLSGLMVPTFSDINYYFVLNVVKFSKFTVSMLSIVGYISLLGGVIMYNKWFKHREIRILLKYSLILGFFSQIMNLGFILRLNVQWLGVSDVTYILFTTALTDTLLLGLTQLPTLVLFAKITPNHVEATVFAVLTGVFNFVNTVLSPNMGILLNKLFVGVTSAHLDNYYQLAVMGMFCSLIPWAFIRLIPTKAEVEASTVNNPSNSK
jgi:hypothetical protein